MDVAFPAARTWKISLHFCSDQPYPALLYFVRNVLSRLAGFLCCRAATAASPQREILLPSKTQQRRNRTHCAHTSAAMVVLKLLDLVCGLVSDGEELSELLPIVPAASANYHSPIQGLRFWGRRVNTRAAASHASKHDFEPKPGCISN